MRYLTKMKLINWHYFSNETVIFDGDTLITGDNGAGKSTLIDALQLVIVANVKKVRFNASAMEERTTRDLKGYLRGKTGTEGRTSFLRNEDFSSYIVMEVTRDRKQYLAGVVFDYYSVTGEEEHVFFMIDEEGIKDELFFQEAHNPRNRRQFFDYLKARGIKHRSYRNDVNRYNYDLRQLFGGVKESFFSLFTKGISFSPITNLRRFVYDYILEEKSIDIEDMRVYLEKFRQVELIIEDTKKEIEALENIESQYLEIEKLQRNLSINDYMLKRAGWEKELSGLRDKEKNKEFNEKRGRELEELIEKSDSEKKELGDALEKLEKAISENEVARKEQELGNQINALRQRLYDLEVLEGNLVRQFKQECRELTDILDILSNVEAPLNFSQELIRSRELWTEASEKPINAFPAQWPELAESWKKTLEWLTLQNYERNKEKETYYQEIALLKENIAELEKNQVLGSSSPVMKLKLLLEEKLTPSPGDGDKVPVYLFCEAIDFTDRRWQNAVEGYLHSRKFDLLVPPGHFKAALSIYENHKISHGIEGVGLVNTDELLKEAPSPQKNSLAEEITSELDYALSYANLLLGNLTKCESDNKLTKYQQAITPEGMLYEDYSARQIPRSFFEIPYIGKEAVRFQLKKRNEELKEREELLSKCRAAIKILSGAGRHNADKKDRYAVWQEKRERLTDKDKLGKEIDEKQKEFTSLDRSELNRLTEEKKNKKQKIEELSKNEKKLAEEKGVLQGSINSLQKEIEELQKKSEVLETLYRNFNEGLDESLQEECSGKWEKEAAKREAATLLANYSSSKEGINTRINNQRVKLVQERSNFTHDFNFSGDPAAEDNDAFRNRYRLLTDSHLKDYEEKAQEAREQAEQSFQENFVAKLGEYIKHAQEDIRELNRALKDMQFGNDTYYFSLTAKNDMRHYYNMITDTGIYAGSIFRDVFLEKHGDAINDLFAEISRSGDDFQETMQNLTDYRTFLDFDIIITDNLKNKKYFSRVARDQSGGETQVPFYVAILASFYQAYQLYRKQDALPLVVFDEAFNRMDADRIEESITFMKNLGFQAVIVAPTGRIQLIIPHVKTNLIIMREGFHSFVERASRKELLKLGEVKDQER